jgi:hypothetical protein
MTDAYGAGINAGPSGGIPDAYSKGTYVANAPVVMKSGTSYTVSASDSGWTLVFNNAAAVTVTVPKGLGPTFICALVQWGAGQVGFVAGAGVTLNSGGGLTHMSGQYATGLLQAILADSLLLSGSIV